MNTEKHTHRTSSPVGAGPRACPTTTPGPRVCPAALGKRGERGVTPPRESYRKRSGQAALLIALSMVALIAVVGLAVDGGAAYQQRRIAQNSVDAAALAGTRVMLDRYLAMVRDNPVSDIPGREGKMSRQIADRLL